MCEEQSPTWPGPPLTLPLEVKDTPRSDHTIHNIKESDRDFDVNPRKHVNIRGMEDYLEKGEDALVDVEELETFLQGPKDVAGFIAVLARNACDAGGSMMFVFMKRKEGHVVAVLPENQEIFYKELDEAIEYMNARHSRLLTAMERKNNRGLLKKFR